MATNRGKKKKKGQSSPSLSSLCLTVGGARRRWGLHRPRAPLPQAAAAAIALARMVPKLGRAVFPPAPFSPLVLPLFTRTRFLVPPCGIPPTLRSKAGSNQMRPIDCNSIFGVIICYLSALSDRRRRGHITSSHSGTFSRTEGDLGGGEGRARRRRRRTALLAAKAGGERARRLGKEEGGRAAALFPLSLPRLGLG